MKIEDIKPGIHYRFKLPQSNSLALPIKYPATVKHSKLFSDKFPSWHDTDGAEVSILKIGRAAIAAIVTFYRVDEGPYCWAVATSEFFQPIFQPIQAVKPACQCNIWMTGCKCGAFKAEQAKP